MISNKDNLIGSEEEDSGLFYIKQLENDLARLYERISELETDNDRLRVRGDDLELECQAYFLQLKKVQGERERLEKILRAFKKAAEGAKSECNGCGQCFLCLAMKEIKKL